jgi:Tol biopolymer transport system component/DNA-binding winged helix-turn-helix (wHTH) protein
VVRFGLFELDARSGELRRSGVRVSLQDQPLKLLQCLLERPGEIVTRDELRGRLWPGDTFVDFDQGVNAAVRRLREALSDSADSPRFIQTLPRRGYRFIAPVESDDRRFTTTPEPATSVAPPGAGGSGRFSWTRAVAAMGVASVLIVAAGSALVSRPARLGTAAPHPTPQLKPLTTLNGSERQPTFSPDGRQVAFAWDGGAPDSSDIYVTLVGSSDVRRLTTDPGRDFAPQWSPDGRQIAYVRAADRTSQRIRVMSAFGGSDRLLSDFAVWAPIAWSTDGGYIAAGGAGAAGAPARADPIYLVPLLAGEPRPLTKPTAGTNDWSPAFSPDGRRLAYASCGDPLHRSVCHVQVQDLDAALSPVGLPRRLTTDPVWTIDGLTWTRDGTGVIYAAYSARQGSPVHLWRVDAAAARPPERIELAGRGVRSPTVAPTGYRLAYAQSMEDLDIYRVDPPGAAQPIARSSVQDSLPHFSPDGRRFAYCSPRSNETFEIWIADLDGSPPEQLSHGPGEWQCSPSWSPDGTRIAFDSRAPDGSWHVWTMSANGGPARQITTDSGGQVRPSWSQDGRWIYFVWFRDHDRDVWRTRAPNGPTERVTHSGSSVAAARESADGTGVWYQREEGDGPLLFQPLSGGSPRPVISCVTASHFSIGPGGIYYMPCAQTGEISRDVPVRVFNPASGENRLFATLKDVGWPAAGRQDGFLLVSPNGRTLLYSRLENREADLMLIEGFR